MKTFQFFVVGIFLFGGALLFADEANVQITSFRSAGSRTRAAELCGIVTGVNAPFAVARVVADPQTNAPAVYNTIAGADGKFCATIVTFSGRAEVSAWIPGKETASGVVTKDLVAQ